MLDQNDLLITGATLGSPRFEVILEAASAGGFAGVSLRLDTYTDARNRGLSDQTMRSMLSDNNLVVNDLDAIMISMQGGNGSPWTSKSNEAEILRAAEALEVKWSNTVYMGSSEATSDADFEYFAETFSSVARTMLDSGVRPYIEFVPSMSPIKNLQSALKILEIAAIPETGVLLDTWHCHVGSTSEADLKALAGDKILGVQLNDIPDKPREELIKVGMHERLAPGQGGLDLVDFIEMLDKKSSKAPLALEVFSDQLLQRYSPVDLACYLGDTLRAIVAEARSHSACI